VRGTAGADRDRHPLHLAGAERDLVEADQPASGFTGGAGQGQVDLGRVRTRARIVIADVEADCNRLPSVGRGGDGEVTVAELCVGQPITEREQGLDALARTTCSRP
jgi:hypothetical protein